jgi:hypothetical protein
MALPTLSDGRRPSPVKTGAASGATTAVASPRSAVGDEANTTITGTYLMLAVSEPEAARTACNGG